MASNVELLTHAHKVVKAKKRQKSGQIKTVVFDENARREFLTGFHKRKLAKKEESKKKAQAREKEERLEARREQRRMLAEQAAQNAAKVEEAYGGVVQPVELDSDGEGWTGIDPEHDAEERHDHEYSDEEQLATVTVVEDFDPSAVLYGAPASDSEEQHERASASSPHPRPPPRGKVEGGNEWGSAASKGKKNGAAKKVRYETKAARRATRATQHARRTEKAERAGGRAARHKAGGRKKKQKVPRG